MIADGREFVVFVDSLPATFTDRGERKGWMHLGIEAPQAETLPVRQSVQHVITHGDQAMAFLDEGKAALPGIGGWYWIGLSGRVRSGVEVPEFVGPTSLCRDQVEHKPGHGNEVQVLVLIRVGTVVVPIAPEFFLVPVSALMGLAIQRVR